MRLAALIERLARSLRPDRFPKHPFGTAPRAARETYLSLFEAAKSVAHPQVDELEGRLGYAISKDWLDELALHTQIVIKEAPLNYQHGRVLYSTLSSFLHEGARQSDESVTIFETGTARGFSSMCMAKALTDMGVDGRILTVDTLPANDSIYWNCIDDLDGPKTRQELLSRWSQEAQRIIFLQGWTKEQLQRIGIGRIHFAFLDAEHTKEDVLAEFSYVSDRQRQGDLIVFDDVTPGLYDGVVAAVDWIEREGAYQVTRLNSSADRGYAIAKKRA